jgi:hypothetical protein
VSSKSSLQQRNEELLRNHVASLMLENERSYETDSCETILVS